jgi:hypothetical protein
MQSIIYPYPRFDIIGANPFLTCAVYYFRLCAVECAWFAVLRGEGEILEGQGGISYGGTKSGNARKGFVTEVSEI